MDTEDRRAIRAALVSGDGQRIVAALADADFDRCAQQVGDALIAAIEHGATEVHPLAMRCAAVLRQRSWDGDEDLATQLDVALDPSSRLPTLTSLRVELDDVADLLDAGNGEGGWINLDTGDSWPADMLDGFDQFDEARPDFDDSDLWLSVPSLGGRAAYRDMEHFIAGLADSGVADRLSIAIDGQGAFRRFRNVVQRSPGVDDDWRQFSSERRRGRARSWLAQAGYQPEQRPTQP